MNIQGGIGNDQADQFRGEQADLSGAPEHIIGVEAADDVTRIDTTVHRVFYFVQESVAEVVRKIQDAKWKGS